MIYIIPMNAILVKNLNKYYSKVFKALSNINLKIKKVKFKLLGPVPAVNVN